MNIFQIFYDESTKAALDPDFIPLDNENSERPDWFEYWPIRKVFLSKTFHEEEYVGFFSPRFKEKTGLTGQDVVARVRNSSCEIISFSPHIEQNALYPNSFHQANFAHPGFLKLSQNYLDTMGLDVKLSTLVQDQTRIIFGNYFVAKYKFWRKWIKLSDQLFEASESSSGELAARLRAGTFHRGETSYAMKIFLMERAVSLVLELEGIDAEIGADHTRSSLFGTGNVVNSLLIMDSLKGQFIKTKSDYLMGIYMNLRQELLTAVERSHRK